MKDGIGAEERDMQVGRKRLPCNKNSNSGRKSRIVGIFKMWSTDQTRPAMPYIRMASS